MTVVRVQQPHTYDFFAKAVDDAVSIVGERVVWFEMFNTSNAAGVPRCPRCFDIAYRQSDTTGGICPRCFGTTYDGGIRRAVFTQAIVGAPQSTSLYQRAEGEFDTEDHIVQVGDVVRPHPKDRMLRVAGWRLTDEGARLTVGMAAEMSVADFAAHGRAYDKGLEAIGMQTLVVSRSFNDAFLKDGFAHLGQAQRLGAQVPMSLTDQDDPLLDVTVSSIPAPLVSDGVPFVACSPYAGDIPDVVSSGLPDMTVGWMSGYTVATFADRPVPWR